MLGFASFNWFSARGLLGFLAENPSLFHRYTGTWKRGETPSVLSPPPAVGLWSDGLQASFGIVEVTCGFLGFFCWLSGYWHEHAIANIFQALKGLARSGQIFTRLDAFLKQTALSLSPSVCACVRVRVYERNGSLFSYFKIQTSEMVII